MRVHARARETRFVWAQREVKSHVRQSPAFLSKQTVLQANRKIKAVYSVESVRSDASSVCDILGERSILMLLISTTLLLRNGEICFFFSLSFSLFLCLFPTILSAPKFVTSAWHFGTLGPRENLSTSYGSRPWPDPACFVPRRNWTT